MSFEEAKQFLRAEPADGGSSLYDHLAKVLLTVVSEKRDPAQFEEISAAVRAMAVAVPPLPPQETEDGKDGAEHTAGSPAKTKQLEYVASVDSLWKSSVDEVPEEAVFPNLPAQASLLEWAGVSFGREPTFQLHLSLKQLAIEKAASVRFWGKIITRDGDYYIVETPTVENPAEDLDARLLMEGTEGPNRYTYLVSKAPGAPSTWRTLPHVAPAQIVVSRQIRRFFTGNLDAVVPCFPPFPGAGRQGTEAELLRAVIAVITADTTLALNGTLVVDEEAASGDEEFAAVKPADEEELAGMTAPSLDELRDAGTWVHAELDLNGVGRTQKTPRPLGEDGEPIPLDDGEEDPEPLPPLRSIAEDTDGEAGKLLWALRACPGGAGQSPESLVCAKSLKWPGAVAIASGKTVLNAYVGFGVPASPRATSYSPPLPKPINKEWAPPEDDEEAKGLSEAADVTVEPPKEEEEEET